jgi:membrane-associated phospholipid phosphatase
VAVWLYDRVAGTAMLVLAALLAFARVYVGTHYPGDVLAGALLGTTVALLLARTPLRRLIHRVTLLASALWNRALERVGLYHPGSLTAKRRTTPRVGQETDET